MTSAEPIPEKILSPPDQNSFFDAVTWALTEEKLQSGERKRCPKCGIATDKISGCNWVKCTACAGTEWCFLCSKVKYIQDGCNDKTHNSH